MAILRQSTGTKILKDDRAQMTALEKRANMRDNPVPLFDNKSSDSFLQVLTLSETAALLKISVVSLRRLYQKRLIPFVKVGGSIRFLGSDVGSYLQKRRVRPLDES